MHRICTCFKNCVIRTLHLNSTQQNASAHSFTLTLGKLYEGAMRIGIRSSFTIYYTSRFTNLNNKIISLYFQCMNTVNIIKQSIQDAVFHFFLCLFQYHKFNFQISDYKILKLFSQVCSNMKVIESTTLYSKASFHNFY